MVKGLSSPYIFKKDLAVVEARPSIPIEQSVRLKSDNKKVTVKKRKNLNGLSSSSEGLFI